MSKQLKKNIKPTTTTVRISEKLIALIRRFQVPLSGDSASKTLERLINPDGREFFIVGDFATEDANEAFSLAKKEGTNEIIIAREVLK